MPTALTTLSTLQSWLGIPSAYTAQNTLLNLLIAEATQAICRWCHRADFAVANYTRILSGNNVPQLALPDVPVQGFTLTGNTVASSAVVTGLSTVSTPFNSNNCFACQSVMGAGIPAAAVITDASQISTGQITLGTLSGGQFVSAPATASATGVSIAFGIALWKDDNAFAGSAYGAFPATSLLQEGVDYYLPYDSGFGGPCESGLVFNASTYWFRTALWYYGLVAPQPGPPVANVKAQYLAGFTTFPPPDVEQACLLYCAAARAARKFGRSPSSLSNDMSVSLDTSSKLDVGLFTKEIRTLLAPYVVNPIPQS